MLDFDTWTFINHGAFGAGVKTGYNRAEKWRRYLEEQPLRFHDRDLLPHLAHSARCLADFVKAPASAVSLVPNVTTGLNAVLSGHARAHGETAHCIMWDTSYGSAKKMAQHYYNGNVTEIPLQARYLDQLAETTNPEQVFQEALDDCLANMSNFLKGKQIVLVLEQTTCYTALTMPIAKLAAQMKDSHPDALVVVDGAHGLLAQDVNLADQFADGVGVYLGNGHKWLSTPRGVGLMAVASDEIAQTILQRPAVLSYGVDEPDLFSRFVWDGCRDYAAALSVPAVLDYFTQQRNPDAVRRDMKDMLRRGIQILANEWHGPTVAEDVSSWSSNGVTLANFDSSIISPMSLVRLPPHRFGSDQVSADAKKVQDYLYSLNIEVPIMCINGKLFVRVSCHVYNELHEFEHLASAIRRMP